MQCERSVRHSVLAQLPGTLVVLDAGGAISWADESVDALLGWSARDLVGRPVAVVVPGWPVGHSGPTGDTAAEPSPAEPSTSLNAVELSARHHDGRELPVVVVADPAPDQGCCLLINRAGDRRPAADLARQVGATAHELGNLIGVILNYATLLARALSAPEALADVGQIQAAAQRGGELVRELADGADGWDR